MQAAYILRGIAPELLLLAR